jgi:hypothetical protein
MKCECPTAELLHRMPTHLWSSVIQGNQTVLKPTKDYPIITTSKHYLVYNADATAPDLCRVNELRKLITAARQISLSDQLLKALTPAEMPSKSINQTQRYTYCR